MGELSTIETRTRVFTAFLGHAAQSVYFFLTKRSVPHNVIFLVSFYIRVLCTGCAKVKCLKD
jgi:hypothetical protein